MPKPTFSAIAARAGVGTATVERVLNGRGGVRPETAERVIKAAQDLDWPGRLPDIYRRIARIEVILMRRESSFSTRLAAAYRRIAATLDRSVQVHLTFMDENDGPGTAHRIRNPETPRSGLIIAAPAHPDIRAALLAENAKGHPVVQVVTRVVDSADFVAIDNYAAGRTAGLMMARLGRRSGPVIAICHSAAYHVHRERVRGFSDYLAQSGDGTRMVFTAFADDERDLVARRLREALKDWPDLAGVYNVGAGNGAALDELRATKAHVFFVGHELSAATEAGLKSGLADIILDQAPETQARRTIDIMLARLGLTDGPVDNPPIRFLTLTTESV